MGRDSLGSYWLVIFKRIECARVLNASSFLHVLLLHASECGAFGFAGCVLVLMVAPFPTYGVQWLFFCTVVWWTFICFFNRAP
jgi:hypothetical protein